MNDTTVQNLDYIVELGPPDVPDAQELVPPRNRQMGESVGDSKPDAEYSRARVRIGRRPVGLNLRELFHESGRKVPPEFEVFDAYELWLIQHSLGVLDTGGTTSVREIGFKVELPSEPWIRVVELFPQTEFVTRVEGKWENVADIDLSGRASIPDLTLGLEGIGQEVLGAGAALKLGTKGSIVCRLAFAVHGPKTIAVGVGDSNSEWWLRRGDSPLLGDLSLFQVVLVPSSMMWLDSTAWVTLVGTTWAGLPVRTNWKGPIDLRVPLQQ